MEPQNCKSGKRCYASEERAHKFRRHTISHNIKKGKISSGALNVYKCCVCAHWHIGHVYAHTKQETK